MSQSIDTILDDGSVISFDYLNSRKKLTLVITTKASKVGKSRGLLPGMHGGLVYI